MVVVAVLVVLVLVLKSEEEEGGREGGEEVVQASGRSWEAEKESGREKHLRREGGGRTDVRAGLVRLLLTLALLRLCGRQLKTVGPHAAEEARRGMEEEKEK